MPLADPQWGWLYADSIPNIVGVGPGGLTVVQSDDTLEVPSVDEFPEYPGWFVDVEFKQRGFPVLQDTSISQLYAPSTAPSTPGIYYPTDDNGTQQPQSFYYCNEWARFTDWDFEDTDDYLTAQQGQVAFCSDGSVAGINNTQFAGSTRIYLPNQIYYLNWRMVPVRLLTSPSSFFKRWKGRVNQNWLYFPGGTFPPGSLMFLGQKHKLYTPPVQGLVQNPYNGGATNTFTVNKLCDIQMRFLKTDRYVPDPPTLSTIITNPSRNIVVGAVDPGTGLFNGGHCALASFIDREYHFALTMGGAPGAPTFDRTSVAYCKSAPLELLFTDCDSIPEQYGPLSGGGCSVLAGGPGGTGIGP